MEREPHAQSGVENFGWNLPTLASALEAVTTPITHEQHGPGITYEVGYGDHPLQLTVYPQTHTIKLEIEISGVEQLKIDDHGVIFQAGQDDKLVQLGITANGECALVRRQFLDTPESATAPTSPPSGIDLPARDETAAIANPEGTQTAPETPPHTLPPGGKKETADPRVKLTGTVRRGPFVKEGRDGRYLRFYLQSEEGDRPIRVYTTKQFAKRAIGSFSQGDQVAVTGVRQTEQKTMPDGSVREVNPVYAYGIKRLAEPQRE